MMVVGPPALPREFPLRPSTPYLGPKIWIILCFFLTGSSIVASPITTAALIQKYRHARPEVRFGSRGWASLRGTRERSAYGTACGFAFASRSR